MKEVITDIDRWLAAGETAVALATVVEAWGSAPRRAGARMAFTAGGAAIAGSVSGGCIEGAVIEAGRATLDTGRPQLLHFGVADETAWSVGLACGGEIDVYVERLDPAFYAVAREWAQSGVPGTIITIVAGADELHGRRFLLAPDGTTMGTLGAEYDGAAAELARQARRSGRHVLPDGVEIFIDTIRPAPALTIVGGAHIAVALVKLARVLGYRTVVIDPRRAFGSAARFPDVDNLIQAWPDKAFADWPIGADTAVVTLSHDPKIDDPALQAALMSDAFYIGALGSRRTHAQRRARLAVAGFSDTQLDRIHAPIGLDIAADNPEEIALAIMAEVVKEYREQKNN